jgi:actin-related protein
MYLLSCIVLPGRSTTYSGFAQRLQTEVQAIVDMDQVSKQLSTPGRGIWIRARSILRAAPSRSLNRYSRGRGLVRPADTGKRRGLRGHVTERRTAISACLALSAGRASAGIPRKSETSALKEELQIRPFRSMTIMNSRRNDQWRHSE